MKLLRKSIFLLLFASAALSLSSCHDGRDGLDGRPGKDGMDGVMNWDVWEKHLSKTDWDVIGTEGEIDSYYQHEITDELLTAYIADSSNVFVYSKYKDAQNNYVWQIWPIERKFAEKINSTVVYYSVRYEYEFSEGMVRIIATRSDFKPLKDDQKELDIRVVYNW